MKISMINAKQKFSLACSVLFLLAVTAPTLAADLTWSGAGATNDWSEAANWTVTSGIDADGIPDSNDKVIFNATSVKNTVVNVAFLIKDLEINAAYSGMFSLVSDLTLKNGIITGTGLIQSTGGKLFFGDGSFAPYTVDFTGTIDDVEINISNNTLTLQSDLVINNTLTITTVGSISGAGTIKVSGDVTSNDTSVGGTVYVSMEGSMDQVLTGTGKLKNLNVSQTVGSSVLLPSDFNLVGGTLTGDGLIKNDGGKLFFGDGSFAPYTVDFTGTIDDVEINISNNTLTLQSDLVINNTLTITTVGSISGAGTIKVSGDVTSNDLSVGGTVYVSMEGSMDQVLTGTGVLKNLNVSQTGGSSILLPSDFNLVGGTLTGDGLIKNDGGKLNFGNGVFASYTVNFTGTIDDVEINISNNTLTLQSDLVINNTLTITTVGSISGAGTIKVSGDVTSNDTSVGGTVYVSMEGSMDQVLTGTGKLKNLNVSQTVGSSVLLPSDFNLVGGTLTGDGLIKNDGGKLFFGDGSFAPYTVDFTGTIDDVEINISNNTLTLQSDLVINNTLTITTVGSISGAGTIKVSGDVTSNDLSVGGTVYVSLVGSTNQVLTGTGVLKNLDVSKVGGNVLLPTDFNLVGGKLTGGGLIQNTGGKLNFGNGVFAAYMVDFTGTIDDVEINISNNTLTLQSDLVINNTLTITTVGSISGAGTIKVSGDVTSNDLSVGGTVYVSLVGSTNQVLTGTGVLKNLNVSKVGGNVLLPTDFNLVGGKLTGGGLIQNTGGKLNFGNGVFAAYMVDFTGTIDDVEINISNNTLTLQSDLVINKTLTITTVGSINGAGTIKVSGDVTSNDTSVGGTVYVSMEGSMDQVLTGTGVLKNLNVSQTVGSSVLLPSNFNLVVGTLTGDGLIKNDGGKLNFGNGVFASYTVNFTGTIDDVEINISNNTLTLQSDLVINNTLTITTVGSISGAGTIKVSGDVTSNDLSYGGNAFVSLVSGINQNLTGTGVLNNLDISKTGGDVLMGGFNKNFTLVTVSAGQWDVLNNTVAASGGFTAQGGLITGAGTLNGNVTVNNAGTLGGTVFINGNVIANTGGTINPGASPGCMTINGNLTLNSGSTFFVEIDGDTPCTEHDQTIVNGTVSINGATLGGITSTVPTSIIKIIDNNLTDGIGGIKFAGAPEGSCVLIGTQSYLISYLGGDGNDVTLSPFIPEINVAGNATSIPDGDVTPDVLDDTDFGNVSVGTTHDHTFTIQNLGTGTLNLTGGTIVSISGDPEFTIQTQPLTSSIANGGPDLTFVVQFSPTTIGSRTATISISNDDCDEDPYTFVVQAEGIIPGAALDFDSVDDLVNIGSDLVLDNLSSFTVEAWINPRTMGETSQGRILDKGEVTFYVASALPTVNNILIGNVGYSGGLANYHSVNNTIVTGSWAHVAMVHDATTKTTRLYYNGTEVSYSIATAGSGTRNDDSALDMTIGNAVTTTRTFDGGIDEVRIWNRILCQPEIQNNMNCELAGNETGLVAYYQFNQGIAGGSNPTETTLDDLTANNNDGTLTSFALTGPTSNWVEPGGVVSGTSCTPFVDNTNPSITCPSNQTVNANASCQASLSNFVPSTTASDNCTANPVITQSPAPGSTLVLGPNTIIMTATDAAGNTGTCSFIVTVVDNTNPSISCPADIIVSNDNGLCGATVIYSTPSGTDNCSGQTTTQSAGLASSAFYPVGTTTNTFLVTDAAGNTATCSFTVTVNDNENPVITCPANITQTADPGVCEAVVTYNVSSSDNCPGEMIMQTAGLASGSAFPVGTTTNSFTVTDASGNTAICSFDVTVNDNENPVITCPANITQTADPGVCEAVVTYSVSSSDNCPGETIMQTVGLASGSAFPVGTTTNSFTVTDASGNTAICSFDVTVNDNENPSITCPADISVNNDPGMCEASVTIAVPIISDNCDDDGNALNFGPIINDYVDLNSPLIPLNANDPFSISLWVRTTNAEGIILSQYFDATNNNRWILRVQSGLLKYDKVDELNIPTTFVVNDGNWHHIAVTRNNTSNVTIYFDNEPVVTGIDNLGFLNHDTWLGATLSQTNGINSFDGELDEIHFWNYARSASEIQAEKNGNLIGNESGLIASYTFDQGNACSNNVGLTNLTDQTGTNDGSLIDFNLTGGLADPCSSNWTFGAFSAPITLINDYTNIEDASAFYPVGATIVTWTATDASGNTATCDITVTVIDNEDPTITCPANITQTADPGVCEAVVTYSVSSTDNCPGETIMQTAGLASGSAFPIGTTTNIFKVTDASGNTATCSFDVTVNDNENPSITCPGDIVVNNDAGVCEAVVTYSVSSTDNCPGETIMQTAGLASGSAFPIGTTTNIFKVTDASGNTATCSFDVTVNDNENPSITCPGDIVVNNDPGVCEAVVTYSVSSSDNCPGETIMQTAGLASGSAFPIGTTTNIFKVTDASGNTATCSFDVTVNDNENPSITCPGDIVVNNDAGECEAVVTYSVSSSDNCPGETIMQTAGLASGSAFPIGTTTNIFKVTDASGNTATCSFDVTVNDNENPSITCPGDIVVNNDAGVCEAVVTYSVSSSDNCPGETIMQTAGLASGSAFPVGTTTNIFKVTDTSGNTAICSFDVTVNDNENPVITCPANITQTANPGVCEAVVAYSVSSSDNCPGETIMQTAGLASGSAFPLGTTTNSFKVTDASGNTAICSFDVTVNDNENPVITCPANITQTADAGVCEAVVTYSVSSSDNCPGETIMQTVGLASGSAFPVGTTTNSFTVTDASGNTAICSFDVTVNDNENPSITCPADIMVNNDPGECEADVTVPLPVANDNCTALGGGLNFGGAPEYVNLGPISALNNSLTATFEACIKLNVALNQFTRSTIIGRDARFQFQVDVNGVGLRINNGMEFFAPITVTPGVWYQLAAVYDNGNITIYADGVNIGTMTQGSPILGLSNDVALGARTGGVKSVNGVLAEVRIWSIARTQAEIQSTRITPLNGNEAGLVGYWAMEDGTGSTTVTDVTGNGNDGTLTNMDPATDWVEGHAFPPTVVNDYNGTGDASDTYPVGATTVTWTATDAAGNQSTCQHTVTVNDTEDPTITCPADIAVNTDSGVCGAVVTYTTPVGTDNCPGATTTQTAGVGSGATFPVGTTTETYLVTDAAGNTATCSFTVTVTDAEVPTALCQDITVQLDASGNAIITAAQIDNGSNDACGIASLALDDNSFDCSDIDIPASRNMEK